MNFIKRYLENDQLTKNERIVAQYIIEHPNEFLEQTTREISKEIFVSPAVITRFARKVGMNSMHDLQMRVVQELTMQEDKAISDEIPVKENDTSFQLIDKISRISATAIAETKNELDYRLLDEVARIIMNAEQVDIYGSGLNYHIASEFAYMLSRIEKKVTVPESTNTRYNQAMLSNEKHVAIVLSHTGNTKQYEELLRNIRKKKTKIVILTGYFSSKLAQLSDYKIYVMPGRKFSDMGPIFFSESTKYVLNVLFSILFTKNYKTNVERSSEYARMANYENEVRDKTQEKKEEGK